MDLGLLVLACLGAPFSVELGLPVSFPLSTLMESLRDETDMPSHCVSCSTYAILRPAQQLCKVGMSSILQMRQLRPKGVRFNVPEKHLI